MLQPGATTVSLHPGANDDVGASMERRSILERRGDPLHSRAALYLLQVGANENVCSSLEQVALSMM